MFRLLIVVNCLLMVSAALPTLQLLSALPTAEEAFAFTSFGQLPPSLASFATLGELPISASSASSSSPSSAETTTPAAAQAAAEPSSQSPAPETTDSSSSISSSSDTDIAAPSATGSPTLSLSPASLTAGQLRTLSSLSTPTIQHHILPAEQIPLPITISTSPGLRTVLAPETITYHQPAVAKVGELVQKIPTAVSHQSQTVVHKHAEVITPIVAPAVRTITSQVVRAYHTPLVYAAHAPVIKLLHN